MKTWLKGKYGAILAFLAISSLVIGGLSWMTWSMLRLEREQVHAAAQAKLTDDIQVALWRLDSLVTPLLARESSRPYSHYSAIFAPTLALQNDGKAWQAGTVLEPSPLLHLELPTWMLLHFQTGDGVNWTSPQVLSKEIATKLKGRNINLELTNVTNRRQTSLQELNVSLQPSCLLTELAKQGDPKLVRENIILANRLQNPLSNDIGQPQGGQAPNVYPQNGSRNEEFNRRAQQQSVFNNFDQQQSQREAPSQIASNTTGNGANYFKQQDNNKIIAELGVVNVGPMAPLWIHQESQPTILLLARQVDLGEKKLCQGILLDWPGLQKQLLEQVTDIFPHAKMLPAVVVAPSQAEKTMTALPIQLDPAVVLPVDVALGWTPLRSGLALTWAATWTALIAVAIGGWSLLNLSERRIRFVSAVTHELRSPLTTLRLYSDMLLNGIVTEESKRGEYLQTMNDEADRLSRLIGNVLAFARLEKQGHNIVNSSIGVRQLLDRFLDTWNTRCGSAGKELVVQNTLTPEAQWQTDPELIQQIVGNLIENACKYSRDAEDTRIIVRAGEHEGRNFVEVEDFGSGVSKKDKNSVFKPFYRGNGDNTSTGGVGLGLALARQWAQLLGGRLDLMPNRECGACFRLTM